MYQYGTAKIELDSSEIDATLLLGSGTDKKKFGFGFAFDGKRFVLDVEELGEIPITSLTTESGLRIALGGLEDNFSTMPPDMALEVVHTAMKGFTGNDPVRV